MSCEVYSCETPSVKVTDIEESVTEVIVWTRSPNVTATASLLVPNPEPGMTTMLSRVPKHLSV